MVSPVRSIVVVIKGAEATAGSTPTFLKNNGTKVPMVAAVMILAHMAKPTIMEIIYSAFMK